MVLSKTFVGFGLLAVTPRRKKIDFSCIMQAKFVDAVKNFCARQLNFFFHSTPFYQSWSVPAKLSVQHSTSRPICSQQTCTLCHDGSKHVGLG
eukprot:COSAG02_NODE_288_length_25612_cov_29.808529_12_plen_93_part_00